MARHSPLPDRPTNLKSLNLATWFFMMADELRNSPHQFSSLPALTVTSVPSDTSPKATTLNAIGSVLLDRQCVGSGVQIILGLPVRISSPGCSLITSVSRRSPGNIKSVIVSGSSECWISEFRTQTSEH